ncbi:hypothetical protein [Mycobacterium sp. 155]|uniref:hypothetical protein n=1 Tax=Mycobacterium sp. 155 TaxID=1157943 RepID=UPI0003630455|nr:hypothetical protein [Mycobacterium sp. 155]
MIATVLADTQVLAAAGIFSSGRDLILGGIGFLAVVALAVGSVSAIRAHSREGAGAGISAQIGTIIMAVLILLSVGVASALTREASSHGISNPVRVESPWGQ